MWLYDHKASIRNSKHEFRYELISVIFEILAFIITIVTAPYVNKVAESGNDSRTYGYVFWGIVILAVFILIAKFRYNFTSRKIKLDFEREQRINSINNSVFDSLYMINSSKIREILRYTYGKVLDWNPVNYRDNVLVYDIHEHIRSILSNMKKVIISIDPERFNDQNVSVELVYCYPEDSYTVKTNARSEDEKKQYRDEAMTIPVSERIKKSKDYFWKLISSGDASGDSHTILSYLYEKDSFYTLVDCCGTVFMNNKFATVDNFRRKLVAERLKRKGINDTSTATKFFLPDIRDVERARGGQCVGSAVGTVINLKNDNPEETFVKAILTINTYGESFFVEPHSMWRRKNRDRFGFSIGDYEEILVNTILFTYSCLLESELSQMYIRHTIKHHQRCFNFLLMFCM